MKTVVPTALLLAFAVSAAWSALTPDQEREAQALLGDLNSFRFPAREEATKKLIAMGPDVVPLVRARLARTDDPEVQSRCRTVLKQVRLVEKPLLDLGPCEANVSNEEYRGAADGAVWSCVVKAGDRKRLVVNGRAVAERDAIRQLSFSADGRHFACWASDARGWFVIHDGAEGQVRERQGGWPHFSPDGLRLAYVVRKGDQSCMVADGREGRWYDDVRAESPWYDNAHLVYAAVRDGKWFFVADGVEGPPHERIWLPLMSRSRRYAAADGIEMWAMESDWPAAGAARLTERRVKLLGTLPREAPGRENFLLTADAEAVLMVYVGEKHAGTVYHGGENLRVTHGWQIGPQERHVAAVLEREASQFLLFDGKEGPRYDAINTLIFSRDGEHCAYAAKRGGRWFMVRDGKEGPAFDRIPPWVMPVTAFSRDGRRLAHLARRGDQALVVLDDVETPAPAGTESIVLAPDGSKVLCDVHADRRRYVWADGRRTPDCDSIRAEFSRDSRHLRYVARRGTRSVMVADGFEGPEHDAVHWIDYGAETETSFRYFVIDAGRETLVEVDWPSGADWTNSFEPVKP